MKIALLIMIIVLAIFIPLLYEMMLLLCHACMMHVHHAYTHTTRVGKVTCYSTYNGLFSRGIFYEMALSTFSNP